MGRVLAGLAMTLTLSTLAGAARPPIAVQPVHVQFGSQPYESETIRSFTVTNKSQDSLLVAIEPVKVGDDFSAGLIQSTCSLIDPITLLPGGSCTHVVRFRPTPFFGGPETAVLRVVVRDTAQNVIYTRDVKMGGRGF